MTLVFEKLENRGIAEEEEEAEKNRRVESVVNQWPMNLVSPVGLYFVLSCHGMGYLGGCDKGGGGTIFAKQLLMTSQPSNIRALNERLTGDVMVVI